MIRGTTALFQFETPYAFSDLCRIEVCFWQPGNSSAEITKDITACTLVEGTTDKFCVSLSPAETILFSDETKAHVQVRVRCTSRQIDVASKEQLFTVYPIHNEEILS